VLQQGARNDIEHARQAFSQRESGEHETET